MKAFLALFLCMLIVGCSSQKPIHYASAELSARGATEYCSDETASMDTTTNMTSADGKTISSKFEISCGSL